MENIGLKPNNQKTRIINAELIDSSGKTRIDNVTIAGRQFIESISTQQQDSKVIDAKGCLLLPGLHDHHTHFLAYAASLVSVKCGPPEVTSEDGLISALHGQPESYWLRGNGFHESVLKPLDRQWLDTFGPNQPIRIQHRSGRLWILNTLGLEILANAAISLPLHQKAHLKPANGHLYDCDELLGTLMLTEMPPVPIASRKIASFGVTGINDMTPSNDPKTWRWFDELQTNRDLLQKVRMSGKRELSNCEQTQTLYVGETKVHLHESALPKIDDLVLTIIESHDYNRNVAVHCVTEVELVFTLSAFQTAGALPGDRIEHASVIPPALIEQLYELGLCVVTQPNFIKERGDTYIENVPMSEHSFLYRTNSLIRSGVSVAFGTDMPFGRPDPWAAMRAATERTTLNGVTINDEERITPEKALHGFLGGLASPCSVRAIRPGTTADCCLLDLPWKELKTDLSSEHVRFTIREGEIIYSRNKDGV